MFYRQLFFTILLFLEQVLRAVDSQDELHRRELEEMASGGSGLKAASQSFFERSKEGERV